MTVSLNIENLKIRLQIWDTAGIKRFNYIFTDSFNYLSSHISGQERFRSMAPLYYRNSNAALLVFDITLYATFLDVKSWVLELQKNVQGPMTLALVGNKVGKV